MATLFSPTVGLAQVREAILTKNWWVVALRGTCAILIGSIAILAPATTLAVLVVIFAAYALVDGGFAVVVAVRGARRGERWGRSAVNGAVSIAAGIIAFVSRR